MNKRTKIELVIFAIVAAFFLYTQVSGIGGNDDDSWKPSSSIETELKNSETLSQEESKELSGKDNDTLETIKVTQQGISKLDNSTDNIITPNGSDSEEGSSKTAHDRAERSATAVAVQEGSFAHKEETSLDTVVRVSEDGVYTDKDQVALYIASYGHLPRNYITKHDAKAAGWVSSEGNLDEVCPGMSIGGDKFGNREGKLPEKENRKYYECDINFDENEGYRGSERIIYSNDGLIYYTGDHYNTFELLYGEP